MDKRFHEFGSDFANGWSFTNADPKRMNDERIAVCLLAAAVCAWLDGGRQRCSIECVVKVLERRCTSVYNGTSWGEWR